MDNRKVFSSYKSKLNTKKDNSYHPYSLITNKFKNWFNKNDNKSESPENQPSSSSSSSSVNTNKSNESTSSFIKPFKFPEPKLSKQTSSTPTSTDGIKSFRVPGSFTLDDIQQPKEQPKEKQEPLMNQVADISRHDISMNDTTNDQTANEILSNFFKRKGETPLNDIEYEGVMALISRSKAGTPISKRVISESILDQHQQPQRKKARNEKISETAVAPYKQSTLIHDTSNISISTPGYKPTYHTIQNDTFDRSNQSFNNTTSIIPSIKRVYQFSGLPSPYSTRLRPPSTTKKYKKLRNLHNENSKLDNNTSATTTTTTNNNNNDTTNNSVNATFVDKTREFKSDTAKTLLSILDGNEQEKSTFDFNNDSNPQSSSSSGFKFINPYSKNGRKISRSIKNLKPETGIVKNSISITANDIDKTISYDKSESLPLPKKQTSQDSSIDKLEKKSNEQLNKESSGEKPSASTNGFSFKKDLVSPSKNSLITNKPGPISEAANEISQENNNNNNNNNKNNRSDAITTNSTSTSTNTTTTTNGEPKSNGIINFNGNSTKLATNPTTTTTKETPIENSKSNGNSNKLNPFLFEFPKVEVKNVQLDTNKVDNFKSLFLF